MYIVPGQNVYQGEVIGENSREDDMDVNPCKKKHVSNMRASGSDDAIRLIPPIFFSLEQALEHINDDELVEVTPKSIRMRKRVLDRVERGRMRGRAKNAAAAEK
jgi:GTP-binding protein